MSINLQHCKWSLGREARQASYRVPLPPRASPPHPLLEDRVGRLRGQQTEALLGGDALLGELVVGREARRVRRARGGAGRGLLLHSKVNKYNVSACAMKSSVSAHVTAYLERVDALAVIAEVVHEVHGHLTWVCGSRVGDECAAEFGFEARSCPVICRSKNRSFECAQIGTGL